MSTYTRWHRDGSVSVAKNGKAVTGTNTYWSSAGLNAGDMITFDNGNSFYEISNIASDTSITLSTAYTGDALNNHSYAIVRTFTSTMPSKIAAQTAELLSDFKRYINNDMQQISGKSAYEIAKDNGYTGTVTQWLEDLKAAGEWSKASTRLSALESAKTADEATLTTLDARTNILTYHNAGAHNSIYRGKNLGSTPTEAQLAAIRAGTFEDMYIGDYWTFPKTTYTGYKITEDTEAQSGKTYYADAYGTNLETQPNAGDNISGAGYFEAVECTFGATKWRIVDFDYFLNVGVDANPNTLNKQHHVVLMNDGGIQFTSLWRQGQFMNREWTTAGGYLNSGMRKEVIPCIKLYLDAALGSSHILNHWDYFSNAVTNNAVAGIAAAQSTVEIPSVRMVAGVVPKQEILTPSIQLRQFVLHRFGSIRDHMGERGCWLHDVYHNGAFYGLNWKSNELTHLEANHMFDAYRGAMIKVYFCLCG